MGYSTRNNGQIKEFWPDDTEKEFYICGSASLFDIMIRSKEKWPDCYDYGKIEITPENIHTRCLTYDSYDYTDFLKISLKE